MRLSAAALAAVLAAFGVAGPARGALLSYAEASRLATASANVVGTAPSFESAGAGRDGFGPFDETVTASASADGSSARSRARLRTVLTDEGFGAWGEARAWVDASAGSAAPASAATVEFAVRFELLEPRSVTLAWSGVGPSWMRLTRESEVVSGGEESWAWELPLRAGSYVLEGGLVVGVGGGPGVEGELEERGGFSMVIGAVPGPGGVWLAGVGAVWCAGRRRRG